MIDEAVLRRQYSLLRPALDERGRRLFAAKQALSLGYGGIAAVARATGIAPSAIGRGPHDFIERSRPAHPSEFNEADVGMHRREPSTDLLRPVLR